MVDICLASYPMIIELLTQCAFCWFLSLSDFLFSDTNKDPPPPYSSSEEFHNTSSESMTDIKDRHRNSDVGAYPNRLPGYHTPSPGYGTTSGYSAVCHTASPAFGTVSPGQNTNSPGQHVSPRYTTGHHGNTAPNYSSNQQTPPGYTNHHGNHTAPQTLPYSHGCLTTMSGQTNGCHGSQTQSEVLYHSNTGYHGNNSFTQQQTGYKSIYPTLPTAEDDLCHNVKTAKIYWGVQCGRCVITKPTQCSLLSCLALYYALYSAYNKTACIS